MKTISFMVAKGGVGKTISSANFAFVLATKYNKKVLLIDLDPQGNLSKAFGNYNEDKLSISDILIDKNIDINKVIQKTKYANIDIVTSNRSLISANQKVLLDTTTIQQTRIKKHLQKVQNNYDYCIFDCSAEFSMATLNAFVASDEIMIPTKVDSFSFDAILKVKEVLNEMQDFNSNVKIKGVFITMFQNTNLNKQGNIELKKQNIFPVMKTYIRHTVKVSESTFDKPLCDYSPYATASEDYYSLVAEYLNN